MSRQSQSTESQAVEIAEVVTFFAVLLAALAAVGHWIVLWRKGKVEDLSLLEWHGFAAAGGISVFGLATIAGLLVEGDEKE